MRIPDWRDLRKPAPLLALVLGAIVVAVLAFRGWDSYVEDALGRWAVDELARQTDSTYRLALGDLSLLPLAGSISFDSAAVATDSARNARRPTPLPELTAAARDCRLSGLDLVRLTLRKALSARTLECARVVVAIALPPRPREESAGAADTADVAGSVQQLVQPLGISSFRVAEISLPSLSFTLERPGPRGGSSVKLEHARFEAGDLVFDPTTASVDRARLSGSGLVLRPDSLIEFSAARLQADFTDSTLGLAGVEHEPAISEAEWVRRLRVRRDRIRFTADSLHARGVAYRAFLSGGEVGIRALELRGGRLDVLADRRIPKGLPRRHRTPQQVAARTRSVLRLDTVLVVGGTISYRERKPKSDRPGVVSFEEVKGTVLHLDLPSRGEPLRIEASARLMGEGALTGRLSIPLDAPDFRYELTGRLGRMPALAFNRFLSVNEGFEFDGGRVEQIDIRQTMRAGLTKTTVTPRYRDLSVDPTGEGGGVIGAVTRGAKEFLAQTFVVRSSNPGDEEKPPRVARTARRYDPTVPWLQFLWISLREGLMEVIKE
ncbi:MAG TPA: hypothetical protein VH700_11000 [Gemmatimonadales bacterium]